MKIYRVEYEKAGRTYTSYRVAFYGEDGSRKTESFADFAEAEIRARGVAAAMSRGDAKTLNISAEDRLVFLRAVDLLKDTGVHLDEAVREWVEARTVLGGDGSLIEAAKFYHQHRARVIEKTVREVVDELVALRETRTRKRGIPASEKYLRELRYRLGTFAESFPGTIAKITPPQIEGFVVARKITGRTRHNWLRIIRTLFKFAIERGYYPTGVDPFKGIETGFDDVGLIGIFTPEEMRRLLSASWPDFVPFIAIGAFAGLRSAEIERLDWKDVRSDFIEVTAGKAKTRSRRLVPILPNLAAWLTPHRQPEGLVCPYANTPKQIAWLCQETAKDGQPAIVWQHNGLRHSYISYRMAATQNESATAAEAGNSPQMIHANYRALVTPQQAVEWFNIMPPKGVSNVAAGGAT